MPTTMTDCNIKAGRERRERRDKGGMLGTGKYRQEVENKERRRGRGGGKRCGRGEQGSTPGGQAQAA